MQRAYFTVWHQVHKATELHKQRADAVLQAQNSSLVRRYFALWLRFWHSQKVVFLISFL